MWYVKSGGGLVTAPEQKHQTPDHKLHLDKEFHRMHHEPSVRMNRT